MRSPSMRLVVRLVVAIAAGSMSAAVAHAQQPQARKPVRGLFGSGRTGSEQGQALTLTGRVFETFDGVQDTSYPDLQAGIRYDRKSRTRSLYVTADTSSSYFAGFGGLSTVNHEVAAGFATNLGRRTRVRFDQTARTSPFYLVTIFPPEAPEEPTPAPELASHYAVFRRKSSSLRSALTVTHSLGRHSSLVFTHETEQSHAGDTDFTARAVSASVNHYLGRYAIAHAGYGRRFVDRRGLSAQQPGVAASHDIDAGIDYNRPLSLSRRTTMVIRTGSSVVPAEASSHYRLLGTASLNREMGRTWRAALSYGRNLEFVETFTEPVLSDTLALRLDGRFSRKLDIALYADLSKGSIGFAAQDPANHQYDTYNGSARLRWAISRLVTGHAEYVAYGHAFGSAVQLPIGFGRDVTRSEIRVGLTMWAPLVR